MGFCSGTEIFDPVVKHVLGSELTDDQKKGIIKALWSALWNHDWDCETDSAYWEHPLVRQVWAEIDPEAYGEWIEYEASE